MVYFTPHTSRLAYVQTSPTHSRTLAATSAHKEMVFTATVARGGRPPLPLSLLRELPQDRHLGGPRRHHPAVPVPTPPTASRGVAAPSVPLPEQKLLTIRSESAFAWCTLGGSPAGLAAHAPNAEPALGSSVQARAQQPTAPLAGELAASGAATGCPPPPSHRPLHRTLYQSTD